MLSLFLYTGIDAMQKILTDNYVDIQENDISCYVV